jgi:hypothetical protein
MVKYKISDNAKFKASAVWWVMVMGLQDLKTALAEGKHWKDIAWGIERTWIYNMITDEYGPAIEGVRGSMKKFRE